MEAGTNEGADCEEVQMFQLKLQLEHQLQLQLGNMQLEHQLKLQLVGMQLHWCWSACFCPSSHAPFSASLDVHWQGWANTSWGKTLPV